MKMSKTSPGAVSTGGALLSEAQGSESSEERSHVRFLWVTLSVCAAGLWLIPLSLSLWLDETATFWVIKDGLHNTIERAIRFEGQSPFYYLVVFAAKKLGGNSAVVLRAPSIIASGLAAYLLYRLGLRLFGRDRAIIGTILFVIASPFVAAASDARPYAIGLMFLVAATLALVRWVEDGRVLDGIFYVLLASLAIYTHYLFALALLGHPAYVMLARRGEGKVSTTQFLIAIGGIAVCLSPSLSQVSSLFGRRSSLAIGIPLPYDSLTSVLAPSALVVGLIVGWLAVRLRLQAIFSPKRMPIQNAALTGLWLLLPTGILYLFSILSRTPIYQVRYYLTAFPALALLLGWLIGATEPRRAQRFLVLAVIISSVLTLPASMYDRAEDWRQVAHVVNGLANTDTPVLLQTAFIESRDVKWLTDPERTSYLLAPFSYYKVKGKVVIMPGVLSSATEPYVTSLAGSLARTDYFILITRGSIDPWVPWFSGRLGDIGFRHKILAEFGRLDVLVFHR